MENRSKKRGLHFPRNVWAVSFTSFFMDISSEMVINILPLFLKLVTGASTVVIGLIEGIAEATASLLKLFSGWLSDKLHVRKWMAVIGYGLSALFKPFFMIPNAWVVGSSRWADRVGKGIRTSPRDALVADSIDADQRGRAFGFHRAADTAGALLGILIALGVAWYMENRFGLEALNRDNFFRIFKVIVIISIVPAILAVLSLIIGAKDVKVTGQRSVPKFGLKSLGRNFVIFITIIAIFNLGNSADAFIVLRAQDRGLSLIGILAMLAAFNLVYAVLATPAGNLSDKIGRRKVLVAGWTVYGFIYLGLALAQAAWHVVALYILYGIYYGLSYGTANAMIADLVPAETRGTAYGTYNAVVGLMAFPATTLAGILWTQFDKITGNGAPAPFLFGGIMALIAALLMIFWMPETRMVDSPHSENR
jgi:MFS family permease